MTFPRRVLRRCLGLIVGLLLVAIPATALFVSYGTASESSRATYERIKMGMTRPEAEAILGDWPQQWVRGQRVSITIGWEAPDGALIEVDFDSRGRVTGKHFAESDPSFAVRMKRLLNRLAFR